MLVMRGTFFSLDAIVSKNSNVDNYIAPSPFSSTQASLHICCLPTSCRCPQVLQRSFNDQGLLLQAEANPEQKTSKGQRGRRHT